MDIALESVRRDAVGRYNGGNYPFPAKFIAGDAFTADLTQHLPVKSYDVVSSQFAIHYSWSTETRARRALRNVSQMLRPGGHFIGTTVDSNVLVRKLRATDGMTFGNSIVEVTFDDRFKRKTFDAENGPFGLQYAFTLQDAVTACHEWMVPKRAFVDLAEEYGLELVEWRAPTCRFVRQARRRHELGVERRQRRGGGPRGRRPSPAKCTGVSARRARCGGQAWAARTSGTRR